MNDAERLDASTVMRRAGPIDSATEAIGRALPNPLAARLARSAGPCARIALAAGTRVLAFSALAFVVAFGTLILLFRIVDPPASMLMIGQRLQGFPVEQRWVALERVSPHLVRAVVMAEDARFCRHWGVDFAELEAALAKAERRGDEIARGGSTLTMQVAKNLFLWPGKSYLRKGLEIVLAFGLEVLWRKDRILEVYLNLAEWGPGVFGAEAAARYHFRTSAARLSPRQAALLAASLPNPFDRIAGRPGPGTQRLALVIERRMAAAASATACVRLRCCRG